MKVNLILNCKTQKLAFGAGKTTLDSDFDGTYMPRAYKHDVICRNNPPVDKKTFQSYFDSFSSFIKAAKGDENKFDIKVTSGRNLAEMNFYFLKIREQGLKITLPESITVSNGGDEFFRRKEIDYFSSKEKDAFLNTDFNKEKREWVKKHSGGWDGGEVRKLLKNLFKGTVNDQNRGGNLDGLAKFIDTGEGKINSYPDLDKAYNHMIKSNMNEEQLRNHIEKLSENNIKTSENPDEIKWFIGELAHEINEAKSEKNRFQVFEVPTTQASIFYDNNITLQGQLERINPSPLSYVGLRDDGNLNFHLALSKGSIPDENEFKSLIGNLLSEKGIKHLIRAKDEDGASRDINGKKLPTIKITPKVNGQELDKFHGVKLQVDEIIKNKTNDLVVVAGDGSNDAKMLNLFNYVGEKGINENFSNQKQLIESLKQVYDLPVISIFVDNGEEVSERGATFDKIDKYFNSDGNVRFIHVNPKDPKKPQNLIEATQLAIREYAKRNAEFAINLSKEMKDRLSKMTYEYPIDKEFIKELEKKNGVKLYNPAPDVDFNKIKKIIDDKIPINPTPKPNNKTKLGLIIAGSLGLVGAIIAGISFSKKNNATQKSNVI